jgi:acetyl-CoA carboxylase carboxyl transferase subunit beta
MNWLTDFVRPKLRALVGKEIPDNLWDKCSKCEQMIFHRDLEENLFVCRHCGYHMRLSPKKRLNLLFDQGEYQRLSYPAALHDPLKFRDSKKYSDRLKEARYKTQEEDAVIVAKGEIGGFPVVMVVFDFAFMGGSMGAAVGNGILAGAEAAVAHRAAFIVVPASGGARMQEGIISLMQMPRTTLAVMQVKESKLPYITLLTDPTTGGVSASFAMLGDISIAEPGAMIGFAGLRVIQQTIKQELPQGFQTAEYLLEHGMLDMVVPRAELKKKLVTILSLLMKKPR